MSTQPATTPLSEVAVVTGTKPAKFDWGIFILKLQTTVTSRKFAALLASLGATWTLYGNHQVNAIVALASTVLSLSAYSYSVATEDAKK